MAPLIYLSVAVVIPLYVRRFGWQRVFGVLAGVASAVIVIIGLLSGNILARFVLWLAVACATAWIASARGHKASIWAIVALFLGPIALIAACALRRKESEAGAAAFKPTLGL